MHKTLRLHAYELQLLHELKPDDKPRRRTFADEMLQKMEEDEILLQRVMFPDEAMFHLSSTINRYNSRIWGLENPHAVLERSKSKKVNVWCCLLHDQILEHSFFYEVSIRSSNYLYMLEIFAFSQIGDLQPTIIFSGMGHRHTGICNCERFWMKNPPGIGLEEVVQYRSHLDR